MANGIKDKSDRHECGPLTGGYTATNNVHVQYKFRAEGGK